MFDTNKEKEGFGWGNFIIGIIFIITALIVFKNPLTNLFALSIVFGVTAILEGIWAIINRNRSIFRVIIGFFSITVGTLFFSNLGLTAAIIPYIFAGWFIATSIGNLFTINNMYFYNKSICWFSLFMNVLGVIVGVMLLFDPLASIFTMVFLIGTFFVFSGIGYIMLAFKN